jgi:hypothetical protein
MPDESPDAAAWDEFCDQLRAAGHTVLAAAPDDPFDRAEGLRYVTRLTRHFLRSSLEDANPAGGSVVSGESPRIGLNNPDYIYGGAPLSNEFEYELRGTLGDADSIGFGTFSGALASPEGLIRDGYLTTEEMELAPDGSFVIALSSKERPGNWLPMGPRTNALSVRQTLLERDRQRPASVEIARVDGASTAAPLDPERFLKALGQAGSTLTGTVAKFLRWTQAFQSHQHEIRPIDPALQGEGGAARGTPNTRYDYSYWELEEDEAFTIEFTPPSCEYWNLQIGNHWLESLDFDRYRTHVNPKTAVLNDDGSVRIVVARRDPGVHNWLDTAGHARGGLALRWVGVDASEIPVPVTRVVKLDSLR